MERTAHAVVIGSGFGGLAAAIRLGARGYRVTVLEKLDAPGGRAYVFEQDGFRFDAGPTIITAPQLFEELWQLAGRRLADDIQLVPLHPAYEIHFHDGTRLRCHTDPTRMREEVRRLSPGDVPGYEQFMARSREICELAFVQLSHQPFESWRDMLRLVPALLRLGCLRSVYAMAARYVQDPRLRFALSFHPLFVGGNPFRTTAVYGLIPHLEQAWGVHFAMGGTGSLVRGLVDLVERQGNTVRCNAEVAAIELQGRRATGVRLVDGERLAADVVVSNADPAWTYGRLVEGKARRHWTAGRLARIRYSMSLFVWYFGTRRRYPEVPHHCILAGPRYRELLDDIFQRKVLAEDFSLYLHRPTATDPSLAPPGCDAFYVLSPVPHQGSGVDWSQQAEPYRARIQAFLEQSLLPGLGDAVVTSRVMTPADFQHRLHAIQGAAFGPEPLLTQSAWFRPHNRSEDIDGLYLVGAGTHPGAGVPGVLSSARVLDALVPDVRGR
jgi:phytoene desaturase